MSEVFHLAFHYGGDAAEDDDCGDERHPVTDDPIHHGRVGSRKVEMEWTAGDDEDQVALRLQSKLMAEMPPQEDTVVVDLTAAEEEEEGGVRLNMRVVRKREPLRAITLRKAAGSSQQSDGMGVLTRMLRAKTVSSPTSCGGEGAGTGGGDGGFSFEEQWESVTALCLCGLGISVSLFPYFVP